MLLNFGTFSEGMHSDTEEESVSPTPPAPSKAKKSMRIDAKSPLKTWKMEVEQETEEDEDVLEARQTSEKKVDRRRISKKYAKKKRLRARKSPNSRRARRANTEWTVDGERVCKTWICKTFHISPRALSNLTKDASQRGQHSKRTLDKTLVSLIHSHVTHFPHKTTTAGTSVPTENTSAMTA